MSTKKTYATAYYKPKTTALFFDHLVVFHSSLPLEFSLSPVDSLPDELLVIVGNETFGIRNTPEYIKRFRKSPMQTDMDISDVIEMHEQYKKTGSWAGQALIDWTSVAIAVFCAPDINVVPVLSKLPPKKKLGSPAVAFIINSFPDIVESSLSWEQVSEIRKDKQSKDKIRRMSNWMITLEAYSEEQIRATIESALDDYRFALKKHGVQTVTGAITTVFTAASSIVGAVGSSSLEILAAGLLISGGLVAYTVSHTMSLMECHRSPAAFLYDIIEK